MRTDDHAVEKVFLHKTSGCGLLPLICAESAARITARSEGVITRRTSGAANPRQTPPTTNMKETKRC
jgi:hypothetical protein